MVTVRVRPVIELSGITGREGCHATHPGWIFLFLLSIFLSLKVLLRATLLRITANLLDVIGCSDIVLDGYKTVLVGEWTCDLHEGRQNMLKHEINHHTDYHVLCFHS